MATQEEIRQKSLKKSTRKILEVIINPNGIRNILEIDEKLWEQLSNAETNRPIEPQ